MNVRYDQNGWYYTGAGANGYREYRMGPADELTRSQSGQFEDMTVAEAIDQDRLDVHPQTGTPILRPAK